MISMLPYALAFLPPFLVTGALIWLLKATPRSRFQFLLLSSVCGSIVVFAFLAAPWAFTSYYLRFVSLALFALGEGPMLPLTRDEGHTSRFSRLPCFCSRC